MNDKKLNFKSLLLLVAFGVLLNFAVQHLELLGGVLGWVIGIIKPFLTGGVIAFILNVPLRGIERLLFPEKKTSVLETVLIKETELQDKAGEMLRSSLPQGLQTQTKVKPVKKPDISRYKRPISLVITLLLVVAVIALVCGLVIPELGRTGKVLWDSLPGYFETLREWAMKTLASYPQVTEYLQGLSLDWTEIGTKVMTILQESELIQNIYGTASSVVGGIVSLCIGIVFAVYVLMRKEQLGSQVKKILYAFLPEKAASETIRISTIASESFSRFLSGQCTEAVILGTMFFIVMTIFQFPYALLCGVFIGFTALVPIFGSFLGCAVGAFLILMAQPHRAIWFIIMFLILQQVEGQLIYPHVVGNAVGLPSIWVLAAVTIGGSMFGIFGMLFFIPLSSVLYALLREIVYKRLKKKEIDPAAL